MSKVRDVGLNEQGKGCRLSKVRDVGLNEQGKAV